MSTVNLRLPSIQTKIEQAKKDSNLIKENAQRFNKDISALTSQLFGQISDAVYHRRDTQSILDQYFIEVEEYIGSILDDSIRAACNREEVDTDRYLCLLPLLIPECSTSHYKEPLDRYRSILEQEIRYATEHGYNDEIAIFLSNPQGYIAKEKGGLFSLKTDVKGVSNGVSYSLTDNLKKLGISVAALSYVNTEFYFWKSKQDIVGYFGVRNSNYPCPLCDEYANIFIPMQQGMVYPLHNRCVCAVVPISQNELI